MQRLLIALCLLVSAPAHSAADWRTDAERAQFKTTPRYDATLAWLRRLDAACEKLKVQRFGTSPEGRELIVAIASGGGESTPQQVRESGKQVVLVQAGIHSGEIEGKDAGLALLRELCFDKKHAQALDHTVLLFIPVFDVDGHERVSAFNRVNQNGPDLKGTRGTAQNLNLNRDYVKADAPEMRAWLALFEEWQPDLLIDVHTTDGADYQYDLTWYLEEWENLHPALRAWQRDALIDRAFRATAKRRHLLSPYIELVDSRDLTKGIENFGSGPRFSTGYAALRNRPGLLVETHMLKPYAQRVRATYDLLDEVLRELESHPGALRAAVRAAEHDTIARATQPNVRYPLALVQSGAVETIEFKGYAFENLASPVSGAGWTRYDPRKPRTFNIPFKRELAVQAAVDAPAAYLVAPAFAPRVAERLDAHHVRWLALSAPRELEVERYRLREPKWAGKPFEGRVMLESFELARESRALYAAAGWVLVPLDQPNANVAIHLLEPEAPDSLLRWGEFNAIFERREGADARVAEQIARDLLREKPALQAEFDARVAADPKFATDPQARLDWFFVRSKWAEPDLGLYPIVRLDAAALAKIRSAP
jgi:hypothetical protein